MGEEQCKKPSFNYELIYQPKITDSSDTIRAAKIMKERGVDLIIFVGDGTARDIYRAVGTEVCHRCTGRS